MGLLAVDMGGTYLRWIYESRGRRVESGKISIDDITLDGFIEEKCTQYPDIKAVGVSFAGQVSDGEIVASPNIDIYKYENISALSDTLGVRVAIENDLNCAVLSESARLKCDNLVVLYVGTGLGCGIVSDGRLCRGSWGVSAEVGHIPYRKAPFRCGCGKENCMELYASGSGIERWLEYRGYSDRYTLMEMMESDDIYLREISENFFSALVVSASILVTVCNPEILLMGGGVVSSTPSIVERLKKELPSYALPVAMQRLEIVAGGLDEAPLEGALMLARSI